MTAVETTTASTVGPAAGGGLKGAVAFEWTKLWSVRATWWNLVSALVLTAGISAMLGLSVKESVENGIADAAQPAPYLAAQGFMLVQLTIVVLATLAVTSEYSSGSIRTTLQSVPVRGRVLFAKTAVVSGACAVAGVLLSVLGTIACAALIGGYGDFTAAELAGSAIGVGTYLGLVAVTTVGVATTLRSAAGTITTVIMVLTALPQLLLVVGVSWLESASDYLPSAAGIVVMTGSDDPYGATAALFVLLAWATAAILGGHTVLRLRDAA